MGHGVWLCLGAWACASATPPPDSGRAVDVQGDTAGDAPLGDGGAGVDDAEMEDVPAAEEREWGMCRVSLECAEEIPDEPKIDCAMVVRDDGGGVWWSGPVGVETRGRSSGSAPKHQYSVELRDAAGDDRDHNMLGMGSASDWVLNGNYFDRSLVRNALAYDLYRAMRPENYAVEFRFCDLNLNDDYVGVYLLTEHIERGDDRVDLPADPGDGSSFLLKLTDDEMTFSNPLGYGGWKLLYPKNADDAQLLGIDARLDAWTSAASGVGSLEDAVDVDSLMDFVLLQEFMKNNDAFYLSVHISRAPDGRIQFIPWDLDLTLGQPSYNDNENPESWIAYRPALAAALAQIPDADARMARRWASLREGPLRTADVLARIDGYQATMGDAIDANFTVWPIDSIQFGGSYLYPVSSYAEEDARVRAFVDARLTWMDTQVSVWSAGNAR